jgi:hypothetical protein
MVYYTLLYTNSTDYTVIEHDDSVALGFSRNLGLASGLTNYQQYQTWLAVPNTPACSSTLDPSGNPNVLFTGGTTVQLGGNTYYIGGFPATNPQVAIDAAASALKVAQAFTSSSQWIYFNQIVTLVAADTANGMPFTVISSATYALWRTWEISVLTAFETYVATPTTANMTALNTALAANPPMNL